MAGAGPVSPSRWVSQGLQARDAVETAERLRLAALLASLRSVRGHVSAGGEAPLLEEGGERRRARRGAGHPRAPGRGRRFIKKKKRGGEGGGGGAPRAHGG